MESRPSNRVSRSPLSERDPRTKDKRDRGQLRVNDLRALDSRREKTTSFHRRSPEGKIVNVREEDVTPIMRSKRDGYKVIIARVAGLTEAEAKDLEIVSVYEGKTPQSILVHTNYAKGSVPSLRLSQLRGMVFDVNRRVKVCSGSNYTVRSVTDSSGHIETSPDNTGLSEGTINCHIIEKERNIAGETISFDTADGRGFKMSYYVQGQVMSIFKWEGDIFTTGHTRFNLGGGGGPREGEKNLVESMNDMRILKIKDLFHPRADYWPVCYRFMVTMPFHLTATRLKCPEKGYLTFLGATYTWYDTGSGNYGEGFYWEAPTMRDELMTNTESQYLVGVREEEFLDFLGGYKSDDGVLMVNYPKFIESVANPDALVYDEIVDGVSTPFLNLHSKSLSIAEAQGIIAEGLPNFNRVEGEFPEHTPGTQLRRHFSSGHVSDNRCMLGEAVILTKPVEVDGTTVTLSVLLMPNDYYYRKTMNDKEFAGNIYLNFIDNTYLNTISPVRDTVHYLRVLADIAKFGRWLCRPPFPSESRVPKGVVEGIVETLIEVSSVFNSTVMLLDKFRSDEDIRDGTYSTYYPLANREQGHVSEDGFSYGKLEERDVVTIAFMCHHIVSYYTSLGSRYLLEEVDRFVFTTEEGRQKRLSSIVEYNDNYVGWDDSPEVTAAALEELMIRLGYVSRTIFVRPEFVSAVSAMLPLEGAVFNPSTMRSEYYSFNEMHGGLLWYRDLVLLSKHSDEVLYKIGQDRLADILDILPEVKEVMGTLQEDVLQYYLKGIGESIASTNDPQFPFLLQSFVMYKAERMLFLLREQSESREPNLFIPIEVFVDNRDMFLDSYPCGAYPKTMTQDDIYSLRTFKRVFDTVTFDDLRGMSNFRELVNKRAVNTSKVIPDKEVAYWFFCATNPMRQSLAISCGKRKFEDRQNVARKIRTSGSKLLHRVAELDSKLKDIVTRMLRKYDELLDSFNTAEMRKERGTLQNVDHRGLKAEIEGKRSSTKEDVKVQASYKVLDMLTPRDFYDVARVCYDMDGVSTLWMTAPGAPREFTLEGKNEKGGRSGRGRATLLTDNRADYRRGTRGGRRGR